MNGLWVSKMAIQLDHLPLLIQTLHKNIVAEVMQIINECTRRILRKVYPKLEEFLLSEIILVDGYIAEGVNQVNKEVIVNNIWQLQSQP